MVVVVRLTISGDKGPQVIGLEPENEDEHEEDDADDMAGDPMEPTDRELVELTIVA